MWKIRQQISTRIEENNPICILFNNFQNSKKLYNNILYIPIKLSKMLLKQLVEAIM